MNNLSNSIQELYRMFDYFNQQLYNSELKTPIITIASTEPLKKNLKNHLQSHSDIHVPSVKLKFLLKMKLA